MKRYATLLLAWFACGSVWGESKPRPVPQTIQFNRDVRPILSENCYACHGPDKNKRKAKLRLDIETGALADLDGHSAIVPGKIKESELYRRITTTDEDDHMPPAKSGRKLSSRDIEILTRWIEQGAKWQPHWSYIPPSRSPLPKVKNRSWPKTQIDHFILQRLETEGLRPSLEADRRTLIRRLSFDLIGLPPAFEEVEAFIHDKRPKAYEQLLERLLASPHYGERMAIHWLDLVRYADTDGYHGDNYRSVYPYRDYVIGAFNDNMPFDRFTLEQIAGDLLPNATLAQKIASTYNRLSRTTEEGGSQAKEYLAKYAADRVRTTTAVWLGGTVGCAECHDHKFDPYTTKDFYSFAAFFADVKEQGVARPEPVLLPNEKQAAEIKRLDEPIVRAEKNLEATTNQLLAAQASWEETMKADLKAGRLDWTPLKPDQFVSKNGATLKLQDDLSVLASGENPTNDHYTVTLTTEQQRITALRLEALTDPSHEKQSLSRGNGNFVLTSFEVEMATNNSARQPIKIALATADHSQNDFPIAAAIDDKPDTGWAVEGYSKSSNRRAVFTFAQPIPGGPGTTLTIHLKHDSQFTHHNIGRFRLALSTVLKPTWTEHGLPEKAVQALRKSKDSRTSDQTNALTQYYLDSSPAVAQARETLAAARKPKDEFLKDIPTTLASVSVEPRVMRILHRGNWMDDSGELVAPAVPQFLTKTTNKSDRATRLDLGRWLASRDNSMAARAFVNRLWKLYFGTAFPKYSMIWARRENGRNIPSCWIGWRSNSWRAAGTSST